MSQGEGSALPERVKTALAESGARLVRLQFTDILGSGKEVTVPADRLEQALAQGAPFDGSSIEGFVRTAEADMRLMPDPQSATPVPVTLSRGEPTIRLVADIRGAGGEPFPGCPRSVLAGQVEAARAIGLGLDVAVEVEFFLFERPTPSTDTAPTSHDRAGYFDLGAGEQGEAAREALTLACQAMGLDVAGSHHEVAPGQHEIDLGWTPAVQVADHVMALRWLARLAAKRFDLMATFMPKPVTGLSGSGLHLSLRLTAPAAKAGVGHEHGWPRTAPVRSFLAGILAHGRAIAAVANPVVNSYKRLVPGFEAPLFVSWSSRHRSPLVRVPPAQATGSAEVLEFRGADGAANPYLVLAALIGCGLHGMARGLALGPPVDRSPARMTPEERRRLDLRRLPTTLAESLTALEQDEVVQSVLGEAVVAPLVEARRIEWELYEREVHGWELSQYLESP